MCFLFQAFHKVVHSWASKKFMTGWYACSLDSEILLLNFVIFLLVQCKIGSNFRRVAQLDGWGAPVVVNLGKTGSLGFDVLL